MISARIAQEGNISSGKNAADLYQEFHAADSIKALAAVADRESNSFGFTGYMFVHIDPGKGITTIDRRPTEWQERYHNKGYAERDPVIIEALANSKPFIWSRTLQPESLEHRQIMSEGADFGLKDGFMVPVKSSTGEKAYLSLYSDQTKDVVDVAQEFEADLSLLGLMMYSAFLHVQDRPARSIELTVRERECLLWAARGKTVEDTAVIMNISGNTVKVHIKHAIEKLGATNKTHAVVRAIMMQLIAS